jgi:hypothetical protein
MTDQPDARPELTPGQESEVRRLLADARHDEPIPADVAERLDRVLSGLDRDDPGSPGAAPVIDLAARRRRRNAAAVLAGAAAVIVAGFAVGQVIDVGSGSSGDTAASSSDTGADRSKAADQSGGGVGLHDQSAEPSGAVPSAASTPTLLRLSSTHLERDLSRQLDQPRPGSSAVRSPSAESYGALGCASPAPASEFGPGELFPALFDDQPAVVVLRPPADGRQRADVLACHTAATLASTSIPAR